ncbi:MAG: glycosyltransferase [Terriglobales bacterium]
MSDLDARNGIAPLLKGRVMHVLGAPHLGGVESQCLAMIAVLQQQISEQQVTFMAGVEGPLKQRFAALQVPVHGCLYTSPHRISFVWRLKKLFRTQAPTTVIAYCFGMHAFVALAARLAGVKNVIVMVQNPAPRRLTKRFKTLLLAQAARPFVRTEVACSGYVAQSIARGYRLPLRRICVVHNCCNAVDIASRARAARTRNPSREGPVLGMVARLDPIKDHLTLLYAMALLKPQWSSVRLRLLGDGPCRQMLEELAANLGVAQQTEFLGSRLDIPEQLGMLDLFVFATTEEEGFGIAIAEAMAAGVPIIASDVGPCREVLDEGRAGRLVPPRDPAALASAIDALLRDAGAQRILAASAETYALEHYSATAAAASLRRLLSD